MQYLCTFLDPNEVLGDEFSVNGSINSEVKVVASPPDIIRMMGLKHSWPHLRGIFYGFLGFRIPLMVELPIVSQITVCI